MEFGAEVLRAEALIDTSDTKAASMRFADTDGLGTFSAVIRSGFAKIATAQSDRKLKIWQRNMIDRGCGMRD